MCAPNMRDSLVRAKVPRFQTEIVMDCFKFEDSRFQVCSLISEGSSSFVVMYLPAKEYSIRIGFN